MTKTGVISATGPELKAVLSRALNTWEPINYPPWALGLCDELQDGDRIRILVVREINAEEGTNPGTPA